MIKKLIGFRPNIDCSNIVGAENCVSLSLTNSRDITIDALFLLDSNNVLTNALDLFTATITGGASSIASVDLDVNRALLSDGSGKVAVSTVTNTELGYVSGVTSNTPTPPDPFGKIILSFAIFNLLKFLNYHYLLCKTTKGCCIYSSRIKQS